MHVATILLPLFLFVECNAYAFVGQPHYIQTGICESNRVCVYNYEAALTHSVDIQEQNVTVSTTFEVACDSTGEYAYLQATKYCLTVTENIVKHEGISGREDTELVEELSGWFCFVQTDNGKIPVVFHPYNESQNIINFKKALVTGFQANFDGTNAVEEMDPESIHMSHYRYVVSPQSHPRSGHMYRYFTQNDVAKPATPFPVPVDYSKEEEIEYRDGTLYHANGETHLILPHHHHNVKGGEGTEESLFDSDQHSSARPKREASFMSYDPSITINQISVHSTYTLDLAYCSQRKRRSVRSRLRKDSATASLLANTDHESQVKQLQELNVASILEYIHMHPDETVQVEALKKYLLLADKSDSGSAIAEAIDYLNNIRHSSAPEDIAMRLKMYTMLAPLTHSGAQQVLLSCVEDVTNATEWSSLLLNIALLVHPSVEFVTQLQSLISTNSEKDSSSLLLVYGALASRADLSLQEDMVDYLHMQLQQSADSHNDLIHLINALGNSGSARMIEILLDFIDYKALDIQLAVINAMRKQTDNSRVLATFLEMLKAPNPNARVIGAIVNTLIKGLETSSTSDVQATLAIANALVSASKTLNNDYINELVSYYISQLHRHGVRVGRRLRRSISNWVSSGPEYNMIASYEARQDDGINYPIHSAYLWGRKIGVKNFNLQVASGVFTGAGDIDGKHKIFGKTLAKVNAFGESATAIEIELLRNQSFYGSVYKALYMTVGGYVLLNFEAFSDDERSPSSFGRGIEYPILEFNWEIFVGVATINANIVIYSHTSSDFDIDANIMYEHNSYTVEGLLTPLLTVRVEGSSTFDVLGIQGETSLSGVIKYSFVAESSIEVSACENTLRAVEVCTDIDDWPRAQVNLSTWFKGEKTLPCGFEQCTMEGTKVPDSSPLQRWILDIKDPTGLWRNCMSSAQETCSSNPTTDYSSPTYDKTPTYGQETAYFNQRPTYSQ